MKFDDPISTQAAQVATELLTQGLPQAIAQNILTTGVQMVDQPVTLMPMTALNGGANIGNLASVSFTLNTAETQTLELVTRFDSQPGVGNVPPNVSWLVLVEWDLGGGFYGLRQGFALYQDSDDHLATVITKCMGQNARVTITNNTGSAAKLSAQAFGSQRVYDKPIVRQPIYTAWQWKVAADESMQIATNLQPNAGTLLPIPIHGGAARICLVPDVAVTTLGRFCLMSHTQAIFTDVFTMPVNANRFLSVVYFEANLPLAPAFINWVTTPAGPTQINCSVTWES